ncbi:MAG: hypothetical protein ACI9F9_001467 [Candidatus Paceibacteria bacterium]|jgi:hypothetical protein
MKTKAISYAVLLVAPAFLAFQPSGTEISFHVQEGSSKTKTFTNSVSMALDDMQMLMNGQESPMMPSIDMNIDSSVEIQVTDEYVKMRDGVPAKLQRTYDSLGESREMAMEMDIMGNVQNQDNSSSSSSELEGETVLFTWSADDDEYIPTFPDGDGDEDLLENLAEDMDFRSLLPEGSVSPGDEWKVDPVALKRVLTPGGDLKLVSEEEAEDASMMGMDNDMGKFDDWFSEDVEGKVTATFKEMSEAEDGTSVAVITFAIKVENAVDLTEKMQEGLADADMPMEGAEMDIKSMDIEIALEGEATLFWNVSEGCAHSFELSTEMMLTVDISMAISTQGMDMDIDQSMEFSGTLTSAASFE